MAFSWRISRALLKSVSPMTRVVSVLSTTTKLSDEIDAQADGVGRVRLVRPVPVAGRLLGRAGLAEVHEALLRQDAEDLLQVLPAERLAGRERQLERRALDVVDQDLQVVRIDERVLGRRVEEVRRVADDELVERRAATPPAPPPIGWPGARPGRRAATWTRSCPDSPPAPPRRARRCRCRARARWSTRRRARCRRAAPSRSRAAGAAGSRRGSRESHPTRRARPRARPSGTASGSRSTAGSARTRSPAGPCSGTRGPRPRLRDVRPADAELPVHDGRVHEHEATSRRAARRSPRPARTAARSGSRPARPGWRSSPTSR